MLSVLFPGGFPVPKTGPIYRTLTMHVVNVWTQERIDWGLDPTAVRMYGQCQVTSLLGPPFLDRSQLKLTTTGDLYWCLHNEGLRLSFTPVPLPPLGLTHLLASLPTSCLQYHPQTPVGLVNFFWSFKISFKHYSEVNGFIHALLLHRTYRNYNSSVYLFLSLDSLSLIHCTSTQTLTHSKCPINICWMNIQWVKYRIKLDSLQDFFWLWHISYYNFYWLVRILRNVM